MPDKKNKKSAKTGTLTQGWGNSVKETTPVPGIVQVDEEGNLFRDLPAVTVSAKSPHGPYFNTLREDQKQWLRDHKGKKDPITRNIRAQAKKGYGVGGNQSFTESTGDMVNTMLGAGPQGIMQLLQMPQSLVVEGIEAYKGRPYNFMDAMPLGMGNNQRFPSETLMSPDAHWGTKLGVDVIADPTNLFGAGLIDNALKLGIRKGIGKGVKKGVTKGIVEPANAIAGQAPRLTNYIPYSNYMKRMGVTKQDYANFNKLPLEQKQQWISALQEGYANPALQKEGLLNLPDWNKLGDEARDAYVKNYLHVKDPKAGLGAHLDNPTAEVFSNPRTGLTIEKQSMDANQARRDKSGLFDYLLETPEQARMRRGPGGGEVYNVSYSNPKNWTGNAIDGIEKGRTTFRGKLDTENKTLSNISFFEDSKIAAGKAMMNIKETLPKGYSLQEDLLTGDSYNAIMQTMIKHGKKDAKQFTPTLRSGSGSQWDTYTLGDSGKYTALSKQLTKSDDVRRALGTKWQEFKNTNLRDPITNLPPPPSTTFTPQPKSKFSTSQTNELNRLASKWRKEGQKTQDMAYEIYNKARTMYPNSGLPKLIPEKVEFKKIKEKDLEGLTDKQKKALLDSYRINQNMIKEGHILPELLNVKEYPNVGWKRNYKYGGHIPFNNNDNQINLNSSIMNQNTQPANYYPVGQPNYYAQGGELPQHAFPVALLGMLAQPIMKGLGNLFKGKGLFGNKESRQDRKRNKRQGRTRLGGDPRNFYNDPMYGYMDYNQYGGYRHRGPYGGGGGNNWMTPDMRDMYASVGQAPSMYSHGGDLPQHFLGGMFGGGQGQGGGGGLFGGGGGGGGGMLGGGRPSLFLGGLRDTIHGFMPHKQLFGGGQQNQMQGMMQQNMNQGQYGQMNPNNNFGMMNWGNNNWGNNNNAPSGSPQNPANITGFLGNTSLNQLSGAQNNRMPSPYPNITGQRQGGGGMAGYEQGGNLPEHGFGDWLQTNVWDKFNNATGMTNYSGQNLANAAQTNYDNASQWAQTNIGDPANQAAGTSNWNPFDPQGAQQQNSIFAPRGGSGGAPWTGLMGGPGRGGRGHNRLFGGGPPPLLAGGLGVLGSLFGNLFGGGQQQQQQPTGAPEYGADTNWDDYWGSYWQSNPHAYSYRGPQYNSGPPGSGWNRSYGQQGNYGPRQGYNMGGYAQGGDIPKNRIFIDEDHEKEDKEFEAGEVYKGDAPVFATRPENGVIEQIGSTDMALVKGTGKYGKHSVKNPESGHTGVPVTEGGGGFLYSDQTLVDEDTWKQANNLYSGTLPS